MFGGVLASFLTTPQGLVASFRAQPEKVVGKEPGAPAEPAGKAVKVDEVAPNRLQFSEVRDLVAQQGTLGVETVDPVPRRPARTRDAPPAGTVITVPMSQGRLLRFDEAVESVFIADPAIADVRVVSPEIVYVYGKRLGLTNLMAVASGNGQRQDGAAPAEQRLTASVLLRVVTDPRPAEEALDELNPGATDMANVAVFGRRAVATGRVDNVQEAVDIASVAQTYSPQNQPPINNTTVAGSTQVNIRVRFAEVSRNDLQSLGIDWNIQAGGGSFQLGLEKQTGGGVSSTNPLSTALNPNVGFNLKAGNFSMEVLIEALKRNGMLHILAEPNLTAVTGETASFLAGGEVPVPVAQGGSVNQAPVVSVQYKPFGVSLMFTPTLIRTNRIGLKVKPEVSSISSISQFQAAGLTLPNFTVRRAETTVEVASGQTFAIAGLFQRQMSRNIEKFPLLGDVPILGQLFTSERYLRDETELVILITPYLVEPVSDQKIATPLDRDAASPWQASVVDPSAKGAELTKSSDNASGFIFK
jgi:pilus assembly protein CpaC